MSCITKLTSIGLIRRAFVLNKCSRFMSNSSSQDCQQTASTGSASLNVDFIKEIAKDISKEGRVFILPLSDMGAMQRIVEPLSKMVEEGIPIASLKQMLTSNPGLFSHISKNGNDCLNVLHTLMDFCGFNYTASLNYLTENLDGIDCKNHKDIRARLNFLAGQGIVPGSKIANLIKRCPELLFSANLNQMEITFDSLSGFFPKKSLMSLILRAPQILLKPFAETELKYEYIYYHMGIEPEKLADSYDWIDMNLNDIIMRHDFLRKVGKYKTPEAKKPQYEMDNPAPHRIFDTSNMAFANEVAGLTEEEWNVFKEVHEKLKLLEDKDEPYAKISVSMRKKFERKMKELEIKDDYYLDE